MNDTYQSFHNLLKILFYIKVQRHLAFRIDIWSLRMIYQDQFLFFVFDPFLGKKTKIFFFLNATFTINNLQSQNYCNKCSLNNFKLSS